MLSGGQTIRDARLRARMTQADLAMRLGTTQSAVARLESPAANPTVAMLERALQATGHRLVLAAARTAPAVDETLIASRLRMTFGERLLAFERLHAETRELMLAAERARGADTA